ncbi:MAG: hypothetical protein HY650_04870 [Acidobacteria bacterium]|nr:hypothetical protein [Acidobacteriota bacterium]
MSDPSIRSRIGILLFSAALIALLGLVVYHRRASHEPIERWAPAGSVLVVKIDDPVRLLGKWMSTEVWRQAARHYQLPLEVDALKERAAVALGASQGDPGLGLEGVRLLLVVTAIEATGDHYSPQFALVLEPHGAGARMNDSSLVSTARNWGFLVEDVVPSTAGARLHVAHRVGRKERIYFGVAHGSVLIGNRAEAVILASEAKAGRIKRLMDAPEFVRVLGDLPPGEITGYASGRTWLDAVLGTVRRHFDAGLGSGTEPPASADQIAVLPEFVFGYSADVEQGTFVDRYLWMIEPDLLQKLKRILPSPDGLPEMLAFAPESLPSAMILRSRDLRQSWLSLREHLAPSRSNTVSALWDALASKGRELAGLPFDDQLLTAVGAEVLLLESPTGSLLAGFPVHAKAPLAAAIGRYFKSRGLSPGTTTIGDELWITSPGADAMAFALGERLLLIGHEQSLRAAMPVVRAQDWTGINVERLRGHGPAIREALEVSIGNSAPETSAALSNLARWLGLPATTSLGEAVARVTVTTRISKWTDHGLYSETRSGLGNLGTLLAAFGPDDPPPEGVQP